MNTIKSFIDLIERAWIDPEVPKEVEFIQQKYPHIATQQVSDAVREKGPMWADIQKYLNGFSTAVA